MSAPERFDDLDLLTERILARVGLDLVVATPLGLGKPNALLNALYRRVAADPTRSLTIYTALSLQRPRARNDLEARFLEPFLTRQFGADYVDLDYALAQASDRLPPNVRVHEFYLQSGALLASRSAQGDYISQNYTHVARDLAMRGVNLIVQLVALRDDAGAPRISLSCNPDLTLELLERMAAHGAPRPLCVAVAHPQLPFLGHAAEVPATFFDLLQVPAVLPPLFALPREPVDDAEHAIGLHASALVADAGTLQIGIGALSDALVYALGLRHADNARWRTALDALDAGGGTRALAARIGGLDPLAHGLHGSSEMVMDGFMHLRRIGILRREVFDDLALERALAASIIRTTLIAGDTQRLRDASVLPARVDAGALARLQRFGLLPVECRVDGADLLWPGARRLPADLDHAETRAALESWLPGQRLRDGRYLLGAFFLGSRDLYGWLHGMDSADWDGLEMTRVARLNQIAGPDAALDALQRRGGRFFNICMMMTPLGAVVSDALADERVVSGVGGQYNFVAMAHTLPDARSILMLRATRSAHGRSDSNIRWSYGHTTIPRHLRDVVITEYGVADLRGRSDSECARAMLAICDARFIDGLVVDAQRAGKLPRDFRVPDGWRTNTPQRLGAALAADRRAGLFPAFPLGSDFNAAEQRLLPALGWLQGQVARGLRGWPALAGALLATGRAVDAEAALARLRLATPRGPRERLLARLLRGALARAPRGP